MADEPDMPGPGDFRRAGALIVHRASATGQDLFDGIRAILEEAIERRRLTALLRAVDSSYRIWIEQLRDQRSQRMIRELIDDVAVTSEDRYNRHAAEAIIAMRDHDRSRFTEILHLVNADNEGGGRLIGAVADIYAYVLPELATPTGAPTSRTGWQPRRPRQCAAARTVFRIRARSRRRARPCRRRASRLRL